MDVQQNSNKNTQQLEVQVIELGSATELTLGRGDSHAESYGGWFYTTL